MKALWATISCLVISLLLPIPIGENDEAIYLNTVRVVEIEVTVPTNIEIHDDCVFIEFDIIASTVGVTDYVYRIENQQLLITLLGRFPDGKMECLRNVNIPVQNGLYNKILLCDEQKSIVIYGEK